MNPDTVRCERLTSPPAAGAADLPAGADRGAAAAPALVVARLTLARPDSRNALGPAEWRLLDQHLQAIAADRSVRALILTGEGGAFSAGGDLRTMPERLQQPPAERSERLRQDAQVIHQLYHLDCPVIAAIPGACMGAGLGLALACDLRLCARGARLGASFHRVGLGPDFGVTWLLPRVVGPARAAELLLTAEPVDAERAEALGLVHRVLPAEELAQAALTLAFQLAAGPPLAQAFTKRGLRRALTADLDDLLQWEALSQAVLSRSEDAAEGVAAFLARRPPRFTGR